MVYSILAFNKKISMDYASLLCMLPIPSVSSSSQVWSTECLVKITVYEAL